MKKIYLFVLFLVVGMFLVNISSVKAGIFDNGSCAINTFKATPSSIYEGESTTISWTSSGCTKADIMGITSTGEAWDRGIRDDVNNSVVYGLPDWNFIYGDTGVYQFTLRVLDENGNTDTRTINVNVNKKTPIDECNYIKGPYLKLISPNGGEIYKAGQEIEIKWKSCNISYNTTVKINILPINYNGIAISIPTQNLFTYNSGITRFTLPNDSTFPPLIYGKYYKFHVDAPSLSIYGDDSDDLFTINQNQAQTLDTTSRIAMWYGKVNQHTDSNGNWVTDPDGISGAGNYSQWGSEGYGDRKLEYCKKFYPNTTSVENYKTETITTWRERGNTGGPHTASVMTTKCVQGIIDNTKPSITVLSPNGGEVYQAGQQIEVKWKSYNVPTNALVGITLSESLSGGAHTTSLPVVQNTINDGSETFVLSNTIIDYFAGPDGYPFKISVSGYGPGSVNDWSDNSFTINSSAINSCTDSDGGIDIYKFGLTDDRVNGIGSYFNDQSVGLNGGDCTFGVCTGVAEGYCKDGKVNNHVIQCPSGKAKDGVCLKQTTIDINTYNNLYFKRNLKIGSIGDDVKKLQNILGIKADGKFGRGTANKLKEWQKNNNLKPDGVFGQASWSLVK